MPLNVVNIGEVVVNALIFDPKRSEVLRTMDLEGILHAVPRLFDLLEQRGIEVGKTFRQLRVVRHTARIAP